MLRVMITKGGAEKLAGHRGWCYVIIHTGLGPSLFRKDENGAHMLILTFYKM